MFQPRLALRLFFSTPHCYTLLSTLVLLATPSNKIPHHAEDSSKNSFTDINHMVFLILLIHHIVVGNMILITITYSDVCSKRSCFSSPKTVQLVNYRQSGREFTVAL